MTGPLRNFLRGLVRATHNWPGPGNLYRYMYGRAARAAGELGGGNKSIVGLYARNSYALGTWIAGLSDIDLTVIWRNASREDVRAFYDGYDRLRNKFPMLGETEMLEERHVPAWTSRGIPGLESRSWVRLSGSHDFEGCYRGEERLDRLRHATAIYRYNLSPLFNAANVDDGVFRRFAAKLFRQLGKPLPPPCGRNAMMAACLRMLSAEIAARPASPGACRVNFTELLDAIRPAERREAPGADSLALLGRAEDETPRYRVVPADTAELAPASVVAMDPVVFRFYLLFVDPLEYCTLLRGRRVFFGPDLLAEPFPVTASDLRDSVLHYTVQMLTVPYRRDLGEMPAGEFRHLLYGWFLRTLRFLEEGRMVFEYEELRNYFGQRHPETEDRTRLMLDIADDLSKHLLNPE